MIFVKQPRLHTEQPRSRCTLCIRTRKRIQIFLTSYLDESLDRRFKNGDVVKLIQNTVWKKHDLVDHVWSDWSWNFE